MIVAGIVLCGIVGAAGGELTLSEAALPIKTISEKPLTDTILSKTALDFSARKFVYPDASIIFAKVDGGIISVTSTAKTRETGGITVELFCQDNMGYFMPIWGGSITKDEQVWEVPLKDIGRKNVDGCYFAVVDSTAEMEAMI